jgi:D-alanine-D-alanine ligase
MYEEVAEQLRRYRQPILVEHFVDGRELTVGVIGNLGPIVARRLNDRVIPEELPESLTFMPVMEIDTRAYEASEAGIYTNRIKTELAHDFHYTCPAPIDDNLAHRLKALTAAVFRVTGAKDVARVDFRLDVETGEPYILEVNPLPGLNPGYSDLCLQAQAAGMNYEQLVNAIVDAAVERLGQNGQVRG